MYVNNKAMLLPNLCKRKNCDYFSKQTKTCDHRLITGKGRGCTVAECELWKTKGKKRVNPFNQSRRKKK